MRTPLPVFSRHARHYRGFSLWEDTAREDGAQWCAVNVAGKELTAFSVSTLKVLINLYIQETEGINARLLANSSKG